MGFASSRKLLRQLFTWDGAIRPNAAYVDWKFRRVKEAYPDLRCVALVEVMQAKVELVRVYVGPVMEHADVVCCSMEELASVVRGGEGLVVKCVIEILKKMLL